VKALALFLALSLGAHAAVPIRFHIADPGFVSLNIYRPDGTLARQLLAGVPFAAGDHEVPWDGFAGGTPLPPGRYTWIALFREGLALKVRGWIGDFGGDRGAPSAAAADDTQVYLGWSLATANADAVVACDPTGTVRWTHRRGSLSGCRGVAVDAGTVFVLGGEGPDAEGRAIYKLSAKYGTLVPWPDGRIDLKITSLWPAKGKYKPDIADYMAVKNGRIYLSFTAGQFIAVLDAKSGAYLQTIVGAPPGPVDSVATKSDMSDKPDDLVDADFVVTALKGGAIGKLLLVHDPIWVVASELTLLDPAERITALTVVGDNAKHHARDIFVALGPPLNQVQARSAIDSETVAYVAGEAGGQTQPGVWQPDRLRDVRAVALDATGQLWVAEGDAIPGRISVWTTNTPKGRLAREFFAPPDPASPIAVNPLDSRLMVAGGCEWRIDPITGRAACLGVVTRDSFRSARFVMDQDRLLLVLTPAAGADVILERAGDGNYRPYIGPAPVAIPPKYQLLLTPGGSWHIATADGYDLGAIPDPARISSRAPTAPASDGISSLLPVACAPTLTQMPDGRVFITGGRTRIWNMELTGIETLRPLAAGSITLPSSER
jgi:hypothetical protein